MLRLTLSVGVSSPVGWEKSSENLEALDLLHGRVVRVGVVDRCLYLGAHRRRLVELVELEVVLARERWGLFGSSVISAIR